jgi:hypothetical protein
VFAHGTTKSTQPDNTKFVHHSHAFSVGFTRGKLRKMKEFDILSFDGGGSKGAMEVAIIQDVMNAVTLICQDPKGVVHMTS